MRGGAFFNGKEGRDDFRKTAPEGGYILPCSRRVSVPGEGNRKGRKAYCGLVRMWSSPCRRDGEVEKQHRRAVTSSLFGQERGLVRDMELSLQERRRGRKVI